MTDNIYTVKVEKMLYEGSGLARIDNLPVFIEGACPGDLLNVKITKINKNYLTAQIVDIVEPSKNRVKPFCPLHNVCGSCSWQHIEYSEQLKQKKNIVYETLKHITGKDFEINDTIPSPKTKHFRCKVQYPVSQTKVSKRILSGYYKTNSHELINIKYCPIQPNIINDINEFLKSEAQKLNISGYDEKKHFGLLKHIIYRISSNEKYILVILVLNSDNTNKDIRELAEILRFKYPQITGVCANFNPKKTNVIMSDKTQIISGSDFYIEELEGIKYKVSANSFFQVNPLSAVNIFNKVKELLSQKLTNPVVLDVYSGVSSIGIWLSSITSKVICVEEVKSAADDAKENIKLNKLTNIEVINSDAAITFAQFIKNGVKFDAAVIDPPRKGSTEAALNDLVHLTNKYIVYVSCNPSTLARDMNILIKNSFEPIYIQPVDMFPHTYHIETIVLFEKQKRSV